MRQVTPQQIREVARRYFQPSSRTVGRLVYTTASPRPEPQPDPQKKTTTVLSLLQPNPLALEVGRGRQGLVTMVADSPTAMMLRVV